VWRPIGIARQFALAAWALVSGCAALPPPLTPFTALNRSSSSSAGEWSGTTSQGAPIAFTVSADEKVTVITVGYSFNGCTGSDTFADLSIPTAPDLTCIPGPCRGVAASYRAFSHSQTPSKNGLNTTITGVFLPGNRAQGLAHFVDYGVCGSARSVEWTATRR
jgi:hypothetical protein